MSKDVDLVHKLLKSTHEGSLKWIRSEVTPSSLGPSDFLVGYCYITNIKDTHFAIYEYQYRHYKDIDEWDMYENVRLEIIDPDGTSLHTFSMESCGKLIIQLGSLVKYQAEDISSKITKAISALDELLEDET